MKTKRVNQYYCDYCKKSGGSAYWIRKHETLCTLNPNRQCGYCHLLDQEQSDLQQLITLLPNPDDYKKETDFGTTSYINFEKPVNEALVVVRKICGSCPACIMAALRQRGIPVRIATNFNFFNECKSICDDFNDGQADTYY